MRERDPDRWWEWRTRTVQDLPPMTSAEFTRWRALIETVEPYEQEQANTE